LEFPIWADYVFSPLRYPPWNSANIIAILIAMMSGQQFDAFEAVLNPPKPDIAIFTLRLFCR